MNKVQLIPLIDSLLPKVYGFAFSLLGDELQAEQAVIDAYTVFLMKEKDFLVKEEMDSDNNRHRQGLKKYLLREITREVYELSLKRISQLGGKRKSLLEFESFYSLNLNKRALLYLKEIGLYTVSDLQEIFSLERHQVIETYYNARFEILNDNTNYTQETQQWK
ncbi:MAG: hypothetical protein ACJAS4_001339 [Bacteriovoracaceae bacterium]|jgi:hypothetical protein